jgi:hypothetical protein
MANDDDFGDFLKDDDDDEPEEDEDIERRLPK